MSTTRYSRPLRVALDVAVLATAYALGFTLRFDWQPPWYMLQRFAITLPYIVAFKYALLWVTGCTRFAWRYLGLREAVRIAQSLLLSSLVLVLFRAAIGRWAAVSPLAAASIIPYGVLAIDFVMAFLGFTGVRLLRRSRFEKAAQAHLRRSARAASPTLLIGAGHIGLSTAREAEARPDLGIRVVGFLDDDAEKVGTDLHGVRVLGDTSQLAKFAYQLSARQALITIAQPGNELLSRVLAACSEVAIDVKIVPGLRERMGAAVLSRIREVAIEDLLRREPVVLEQQAIQRYAQGRVVLVTGAAGSIGSELCRQLLRFGPRRLILLDHWENGLFQVERDLRENLGSTQLSVCVGDIGDGVRMREIFASHGPSVVFHAAAHKHVPLMEGNPVEAIKNNLFGTQVLADLAVAHDVERFVLISTDKAVNPSSVMGASKRAAELYVQSLNGRSGTRLCAVRFGNVLGSTGSVVPLFREQIQKGGPVQVTHPDMQRYFMTVDEACQLVLQAAALGEGGETFLLDMGEPLRILDLARDLIRLSGLREGHDIQIEFTGSRPGEKLHEELGVLTSNAIATAHPKIFVCDSSPVPASLTQQLQMLRTACDAGREPSEVLGLLSTLVPEYAPQPQQPPPSAARDASPTDQPHPNAFPAVAPTAVLATARGRS